MPDTSQTKIAVLGWFKGLEGEKKTPGRKRKTQLHWSRILREAGNGWSESGTMGHDRDRGRDTIAKNTLGCERGAEVLRWRRRRG